MKNAKQGKKTITLFGRQFSSLHVLIAVVALLECLALVSFTTYSWIETASSLIIKTGRQYYEDSIDARIPIANALNYKFVIDSSGPSDSAISDLNNYFSYSGESNTKNLYRFARASSPDGKTFFFPKKNNLNSSATTYRKGDIIDSNSNITHFDFVVSNTSTNKESGVAVSSHKFKFYFKDANVFTVSKGDSNLTGTQLTTIKNAMRISFQTGSGTPVIYSVTGLVASAISDTQGHTVNAYSNQIKSDANNQKLFTIGKNSEQNISVRIWLENTVSGMSDIDSEELAKADIGINLQLTYAENDYDYLYFDDYTFSSEKGSMGAPLTYINHESDSNRMYFAYSENGSTYHYYPMTIDNSSINVDATSWVTCNANGVAASTVPDTSSQGYIAKLTAENAAALTHSYFAYGAYPRANVNTTTAPPSAPIYKWKLNGNHADDSSELRFNAYSVTKTDANTAYGAGGWAWDTPLSLVYFRDLATGVTTEDYNTGDNFKYITKAVNADSDDLETGNRSNVMYVNNGLDYLTDSNKAGQAEQTATMFYEKSADDGNGLFKSFIPSSWLNSPLRFNYCPDGFCSNCCVSWYTTTPSKPAASNDYIYTALGCTENYDVQYYSGSEHSGRNNWINPGAGTWNEIESEPVAFSTELIDSYATKDHRYQIGVKIENSESYSYYHLVPDATRQKFLAYIPKPGTNANASDDYDDGAITFRRFTAAENYTTDAFWVSKMRKGSRTFYPVKTEYVSAGASVDGHGSVTKEATDDYTRGYWNISVIVDGTYEHFFWDTRVESDPDDDGVLGTFQYNTTGHTGDSVTYTDVTTYMLDEYRWYVPLDDLTTIPEYIFYKWEPYTNTVFKYSQKLSDGIFCVITEAPDNTPDNAFTTN